MRVADKYLSFVRWSEEDRLYVGYARIYYQREVFVTWELQSRHSGSFVNWW